MPVPDNSGSSRPRSGLREFPEDGGAFDALLPRQPETVTGGGTPAENSVPVTPQTGGPGSVTQMPGIPPADGGGTPAETGGMPATGGGGQIATGTLAPQTGGGTPPDMTLPQPGTGGRTPAETAGTLIPLTGGGTPAGSAIPAPSTGGGAKGSDISAPPGTQDSSADLAAALVKAGGSKTAAPGPATTGQTAAIAAQPAPAAAPTAPAPQDASLSGQSLPAASASTAGQAQQAAAQAGSDAAMLAAARPQAEAGLRPMRQGSEKRVISDAAFTPNNTSAGRTAGSASLTAPPVQTGQTGLASGQTSASPASVTPEMTDMAKAVPLPATPAQTSPNPGGGPMQVMADAAPDPVQGQETLQRTAEAQSSERPTPQAGAARMTPQSALHLAAQIAQRFTGGSRQFDIRMDPAELGRVDVRLQVGNDNRVHAILSAERPETLAELQRTARELERALADAGLELGESGLEFQLSQGGSDREFGTPRRTDLGVYAEVDGVAAEPVPTEAAQRLYGFTLSGRSGVDVRI